MTLVTFKHLVHNALYVGIDSGSDVRMYIQRDFFC